MQRYFQQELFHLKELAREFSEKHPALAPMLSGPSSDPDVERLLEGTAFLTGLLRRKLDDEFPEIIHDVMDLVAPQYLRQIPATTILTFSPERSVSQPQLIRSGVTVASRPVEGTSCLFRTCYDVELQPMRVADATFQHPAGHAPEIKISFVTDVPLSTWKPKTVRFFINDDRAPATDVFRLILNHATQVRVMAASGVATVLPPSSITPVGFERNEAVIPYPANALPGYRLLQEYFFCHEKFLFFDIDLSGWRCSSDDRQFEIIIQLHNPPVLPMRVSSQNFVLHATPVINLYPHTAEPVSLDHAKTDYLLRPSGRPGHHRIYSVDRVKAIRHGSMQERLYSPFNALRGNFSADGIYRLARRPSPIGDDMQVLISVAYSPGEIPVSETLSVGLTCTNGDMVRFLKPGDVCVATDTSPTFATFSNITPVRSEVLPPLGSDVLWRLQSHMALNQSTLETKENLQALLGLYLFDTRRDSAATLANRKRIDGVTDVSVGATDRIVKGLMMRGRQIVLTVREDHFASPGDMYLFGCVIDRFLAGAASLNSFTFLTLKEEMKGELLRWNPRCGNRPLL